MAFTIPEFEPYKRGNPLASALSGYTEGQTAYQDFMAKKLANQKAQELMQFVTPQAREALRKIQIENQFNQTVNRYQQQDIQTTLAIKNAERQYKEAQSAIEAQKARHPSWNAPAALQLYEYANEQDQGQGQNQGGQGQAEQPAYGPMSLVGGGEMSPQANNQPQQKTPQQQLATGMTQQGQQQEVQNLENPMAKYGNIPGSKLRLKLANDPAFKEQYESDKKRFEAQTAYAIKQEQDAIASNKEIPEVRKTLTGLSANYEKSKYKGVSSFGYGGERQPGQWTWNDILNYGAIAATGVGHDWSPEQQADIGSRTLATKLLPLFKGGPTEKEFFNVINNMKPSRLLDKKAFQNQVDIMNAGLDRLEDWNKFQRAAKAKGFTNPYAIENMFLNYQNAHPALKDDGTVNTENLGNSMDYLNADNYKASLEGRPYEVIKWDDIKYSAKENNISTSDAIFRLLQEGRITKEQAEKFIKGRK